MGFAAGYTAGTNARIKKEQLELAKEEAAQNAKLKRQQLSQARDAMNLKLMQAGYSRNGSGGFDVVQGGAADAAQQERNLQMQEIAVQGEAMRSLQGRLAASATDMAIEDFVESGDAGVFQRALDNDPFLKQAWDQRGVQLITNVDFENDGKLLEAAGITQDYVNNPEARDALKKSIWKYHDGKQWNIGLLDQLVAETGALKRMSTKRGDMIVGHMGRLRSAMKGVNVELEQQKADTSQYIAETGRGQMDVNRMQAQTAQRRLELAGDQAQKGYLLDLAELDYKNRKLEHDLTIGRGGTGKQKDMIAAKQQTDGLLQEFGGEEAFFNTDFGDDKNYNRAYQYIAKIERFEDVQLSEAEKKELNNIRQLIALADPAKKLSSADTGVIDKFLGGMNKYLSDEVGGLKAKSSYAAFRNTVRHALFGSALTEAEITSFNEAFGTLGQKLGPVLQQFRTNLVQVKAKLESMRRNSNPYTMKVRMGVDQEKLDTIISAFDARIDYLSGATNPKVGSPQNYAPQPSSSGKPSLDELFEQTQGSK